MDFPIKTISDLEKISSSVRWQYFEKLAAFIFEQNSFDARQNVVVKSGGAKRQFDVIAQGLGKTFLVECKKWKNRKEKIPALRYAVRKHRERCEFYSMLHEKENIFPVVVTLLNEEISMHDDIPIVPIMKLNAFLQDCDFL